MRGLGMDVPTEAAEFGAIAAQTVFKLLLTEAGERVRDWLGTFVGRGRPKETAQTLELINQDREQLLAADTNLREMLAGALAGRWSIEIQRLVDEDPHAAQRVRAFVEEWEGVLGPQG